jgi:hypothetical protein
VPPRFEIIFCQASSADAPVVLRTAADANEATMVFHEELARLRTQGATGEVVMRAQDNAHTPLLRQPLNGSQNHACGARH